MTQQRGKFLAAFTAFFLISSVGFAIAQLAGSTNPAGSSGAVPPIGANGQPCGLSNGGAAALSTSRSLSMSNNSSTDASQTSNSSLSGATKGYGTGLNSTTSTAGGC